MSNTISTLNALIETLKDGQAGFRDAASNVKSSELKSLFSDLSLQRSKFAGELQMLAHASGESSPADSGTAAGALHRGWIDLKAALTKQDDHAILAECERGEDSAVAAYEKAFEQSDLPGNARETLQRQFTDVRAAHDRVKQLRDGATNPGAVTGESREPTMPSARENPGGMVEKAPFGNT